MIYLVLSIICSTSLLLLFKGFKILGVDTFKAIVINYAVCSCLGLINILTSSASPPSGGLTHDAPWLWFALGLGFIFIIIFHFIAKTTQRLGVTVATIAVKLSLVLPVAFAIVYYQEPLQALKAGGIATAIIAIYFSSWKPRSERRTGKRFGLLLTLGLPFLIFIGSGVVDTSIKFVQEEYLGSGNLHFFLTVLFGSACLFGLAPLLFKSIFFGEGRITQRTLAGGILLGIPNYGSIYYLIKTLELDRLQSSVVFPINNMSIVGLSVILAFLIFKEKLNLLNIIGLIMAFSAILMISFA